MANELTRIIMGNLSRQGQVADGAHRSCHLSQHDDALLTAQIHAAGAAQPCRGPSRPTHSGGGEKQAISLAELAWGKK